MPHAPCSLLHAQYEYGPFGEPILLTGPMARENPFRLSTKRTDHTTELGLYEYRAYSPTLGRWLSRDPIAELGFQPKDVAPRFSFEKWLEAQNTDQFQDQEHLLYVFVGTLRWVSSTCSAWKRVGHAGVP